MGSPGTSPPSTSSINMASNTTMYYDVFAKSMDLEEALEDSPMFRKKIKNAENTVDDFSSGIKKIIKSSRHYQASARSHEECFNEFISEVITLKNTMGVNDDVLDKGFMKLVNGLKEIAHFQDLLTQQIEGLISPLQDFINNDVKVVKEHTKKYEKATTQLDSVVAKLGQVKKKNSQKVEELESDLAAARRAHTAASLDVAVTMNEVLAKKRFEFLERIEVYMHAQMTYFHQGYDYFKDLAPSMKAYANHLAATRNYFETERKRTRERRVTLETNPAFAKSPQQVSQTVKRGYLFKRSAEDVINTWSKRYFVLQDNQLCAYKTGKDQQPDLVLQLLLYTVKARDDLDRRNCFELVSPPDKSVLLQAENEESKHEWIQAIQGCISNLLNAQPSQEEKITRKTMLPLDGANDVASETSAVLKQANPVCADCDSKDPEWASINLGVLLCIDCSGIHRSMGVHISKVRSLTLDAWDADLIEVILKLGNTKVNEIYEAQVPTDRSKPTCSASWEIRQKWIRDKYECKKFVIKPSSACLPAEMHMQLAEAITKDDAANVLKLYAQGIDLNYQDPNNNKRTALHLCVAANRPALVLFMLLNAADPALKDEQGWTPLHLASDLGLANCAIPLLQKNTVHILSFTDNNNRTPLDIAVHNGGADCVTLFRLAALAREESGNVSFEESFAQALKMFSRDARTKS